jgi:pre-mRNA-splicing factor SPF27
LPPLQFSELFQKELDRKAENAPIVGGIDLSRYEAPEKPTDDSDGESWRKALRQAYISRSYLSGRLTNLSLLEEYGKNAWLISNSQLEDILRDLERELSERKEGVEKVNRGRKTAQENSRAELTWLEEAWKQGVGKIIEVQLATDGVKRETLQRKRNNG